MPAAMAQVICPTTAMQPTDLTHVRVVGVAARREASPSRRRALVKVHFVSFCFVLFRFDFVLVVRLVWIGFCGFVVFAIVCNVIF
jgi:hypothetical protein